MWQPKQDSSGRYCGTSDGWERIANKLRSKHCKKTKTFVWFYRALRRYMTLDVIIRDQLFPGWSTGPPTFAWSDWRKAWKLHPTVNDLAESWARHLLNICIVLPLHQHIGQQQKTVCHTYLEQIGYTPCNISHFTNTASPYCNEGRQYCTCSSMHTNIHCSLLTKVIRNSLNFDYRLLLWLKENTLLSFTMESIYLLW
jgi:hypothetical protein